MKHYLFLVAIVVFCGSLKASDEPENVNFDTLTVLSTSEVIFPLSLDSVEVRERPVKFKRGKAIIFTILTGLLGGHRIYLGTHHRTPIIYSVTLGGLGILPFVDLINLIFTKDISKFEDKSQIIMWGK